MLSNWQELSWGDDAYLLSVGVIGARGDSLHRVSARTGESGLRGDSDTGGQQQGRPGGEPGTGEGVSVIALVEK